MKFRQRYNRNLGSKKDQGIVTPSSTPKRKRWNFFRLTDNYKVLQNLWRNNVAKWVAKGKPVDGYLFEVVCKRMYKPNRQLKKNIRKNITK